MKERWKELWKESEKVLEIVKREGLERKLEKRRMKKMEEGKNRWMLDRQKDYSLCRCLIHLFLLTFYYFSFSCQMEDSTFIERDWSRLFRWLASVDCLNAYRVWFRMWKRVFSGDSILWIVLLNYNNLNSYFFQSPVLKHGPRSLTRKQELWLL